MSAALSFTTALELNDPADADSNIAVLQAILTRLNNCAAHDSWAGSAISQYVVIDDHASITIVPGTAFATIDDLRTFRQAQRAEREQQREQGRLF